MGSMRVRNVLTAMAVLAVVFSPSIGESTTSTVDAVASLDPMTLVKSATVNRGSAVSFYGSGSRGVPALAYTWSFRDGSTSVEANPVHTFDRAGTYDVSLILQDGSGRMDLDRVTVRVRQPLPGVDFDGVDAGADRTAVEDETLTFEALVSWPGADPSSLSYAWDFGDGTPLAGGAAVSHAFANAGSYTVRVTVTDSTTGAFDADEVMAEVANVAPVADAGPDSVSAFEDDLASFDARATYDTPSDRRDLAYAWDFGDGQRGSGETASHAYARAGTYFVQLTATDDNGVASTDGVSVHVENAIPRANAGAPLTVTEGDPAILDGRASTDTPSDRLSLEYAWVVDPTLPTLSGWGPSYTWFDDGLPSVGLVVTDDDAASAASALSVVVTNAPPRVGITGIWWFQDELLLEGYAFDPGADDLTFEWSVDGLPWYRSVFPAGGAGPREVYGYALNPPREVLASEWEVTLSVSDGDGGVGQDSVTILLARASAIPRPECAAPPAVPPGCPLPPRDAWSVDNLAPRVDVADTAPEAPEDLTVAFGAESVEDPDSQALAYLWEFGNGETAAGETVLHGFRDSGVYTVILTVEDDEGDRTSNAMRVTITNMDPVAGFPSPYAPQEDEAIVLWRGDSSDTPSDAADLVYAWRFSDGAVAEGTYGRHAFTKDGAASVALTVIDDNGASSESRADFEVANAVPLAVAAGPPRVLEGEAIALEAGASLDSPSDVPGLTYEWTHDAHLIATGRNPVLKVTGNGMSTFLLRVRDDRGADDTATIDVLVENVPPRVYAGPDLVVYGTAQSVVFEGFADDLAGGPSLVASWAFSDGGRADGFLVTHSFTASGIYSACLEVSDGFERAEDCATVEVSLDTDGDSLLEEAERSLGTDPAKFDTDGDSLTDYHEYIATHTDPARADTDADRLNDWEELYLGDDGYVTNPMNPDTDADHLTDGDEVSLVRAVTFLGRDEAYLGTDLAGSSYYVERVNRSSGAVERATFDLAGATREYQNLTGSVEYQVPCFPFPCLVEYRTDARFRWTNMTVDLMGAGFEPKDFSRTSSWTFGHADRLSSVSVLVGSDRILGAEAFLSFSNVEYSEIDDFLGLDFVTFRDTAFYASEFRITVRARTSPVVFDGDHDGLGDGEEVDGWVAVTLNDIDAIERFEASLSAWASAETILEAFTVRDVSSSPLASDADWDYLLDGRELSLGLDPNAPDSDNDGEIDGWDPDPSVVDPYGPSIVLIDELIEFGIIDLKTYHLTFRICDGRGVVGVQSIKNAHMLRVYELPRPKRCLDFYTAFKIGIHEVFTGADFFVLAVDATGSLNAISLRQPTLFIDVLDGFMKELTKHFAGPVAGGMLSGLYWALRDSIIDMADLIFNFPQVLAALAKVGAAFGRDPTGTMWEMMLQILRYLDSEQNASNPYPEGSGDRELYRFFWYQGYVAGSMLLAWTGSQIATATFKPLRFRHAFVADDILDAGTDAGALTKKAGLWARFNPSTKFMLVAGSFTTAFALASYVWPEVFQGVFSRFTAVAFPVFVLGSMVSPAGPGGANPARRAVVLFDGYMSGAVPGPRFFKRSVGLGAGDAVLASAGHGHKVWRYIRAAGDVDVFDPGLRSQQILRFLHTQPGVRTALPDASGFVDGVATLKRGLYDAATEQGWGRWYYQGKHIDGTIVKFRADGVTPRYNSFFPLGQTISGNGYPTFALPAAMTRAQVDDLIAEALVFGRLSPDGGRIAYQFHRYGIDEVVVELTPEGTVASAFPVRGSNVWAWDPDRGGWIPVP